MRDLEFLSGKFFETEISKDKQYLLKYFTSPEQVAFLRYYLVFGDCKSFREHTGYPCSNKVLKRLETLFQTLVTAHREAKEKFDIDLLWKIENGEYK